MLLGGLGRMGLGVATSTLGGLGMGIGYGFGVRLGYNAYKPNQDKAINKQVLSLNPIEAGNGMGRDVASRQFNATSEPSLKTQAGAIVTPTNNEMPNTDPRTGKINLEKYYVNRYGVSTLRSNIKSHEQFLAFQQQRPKRLARPKSRGRLSYAR